MNDHNINLPPYEQNDRDAMNAKLNELSERNARFAVVSDSHDIFGTPESNRICPVCGTMNVDAKGYCSKCFKPRRNPLPVKTQSDATSN